MMLVAIIVVLLILVALAAFFILSKAQSPQPSHIRSKAILTPNELEFFRRLRRALPDLYIFPQVSANALLQVERSVDKKQRTGVRNRFAQKHVDFVLCDGESLAVVAIIELDDRTHHVEKDKTRDAIFEGAGYRVIRFASSRKPSEEELAALFVPPALPAGRETEQF